MTLRLALISALSITAQAAYACPACAVSNNQHSPWVTFGLLAVMGVIPIVLAAWVGLKIARILRNEKTITC